MTKAFFDHISTTPLDPSVFEAMRPYFTGSYGNPSSHIHDLGQVALRAVDRARAEVAALIGAGAGEIVFTSGATESNNLAVLGGVEGASAEKRHVVISDVEHFSVTNALIPLRNAGYEVTVLPVDRNGLVDPDDVRKALRPDTALLSVMHANSEIGTIEPVGPIGRIAKSAGVTFHVDATASAGHIPLDVGDVPADLVTLSAHNFYGPKGVGALYIREGTRVAPRSFGGFQESGLRAGTENVPGVVGMGAASVIAAREMGAWADHLLPLGRKLWDGLAPIHLLHFTGHPSGRLPGHVSFWVEHAEGESLLLLLNMKGIMAASGSACSSNLRGRDEEDLVASPVLRAIGVPTDICTGSITFSLGKGNTEAEVDAALDALPGIVDKLRAMSPTYLDYRKRQAEGG